MCDICLKSPCHPRCPNAPAPIAVFVCAGCGEDIYEGDDYWDLLGEQFCSDCIENSRRVAECYDFD